MDLAEFVGVERVAPVMISVSLRYVGYEYSRPCSVPRVLVKIAYPAFAK